MKKLSVFDLETDPFKYGRKPIPFAAGFYDGKQYKEFWGENCLIDFIEFVKTQEEPLLIYAHNGGKFDFMYLLEAGVIENPIKIINGRIVSAMMGIHELRDSYSILPVPLSAYKKDDIDYDNFEKEKREKHKLDILHYLATDCEYLYEFVEMFLEEHGDKLTIGAAAMKTLKSYSPFKNTKESHDTKYRPFYFGGRVQCFDRGEILGDFEVIDVNSMYPDVMSRLDHPTGEVYENISFNKLDENGFIKGFINKPYFIHFTGLNRGAFPTRTKLGLDFNIEHGEFWVTGWELQIALKYDLVDVQEVHSIRTPEETINFREFIDVFMEKKVYYKEQKDVARTLISKLIMNSSYGKFGQNPNNFYDYFLSHEDDGHLPDPWEIYKILDGWAMYRKPAPKPIYYDVATAASITGAARAVLLEALQIADTPLYCDTDSIICKGYSGKRHPTKLGYWDLEAKGNKLYLGGKKLYSLFDDDKCVKIASKGVRLSGEEIKDVALGEARQWKSDAPNFKLDGSVQFIQRTVRRR